MASDGHCLPRWAENTLYYFPWGETRASEEGQAHSVRTAGGLSPLGLRARMCCSEGDRHAESSAPLRMMGWVGGWVEVKLLPHFLLPADR